jgi:hypothetical protein
MPDLDALNDDAIFEVFQQGLFAARAGDLRDYDTAGIRAVRDHILARVVDPLAAEVLALREVLASTVERLESMEPVYYEDHEAGEYEPSAALVRARAVLARPLPEVVRRREAEARLGRAHANALAAESAWLTLPYGSRERKQAFERAKAAEMEAQAALDALRALDGDGHA